MNAAKKQTSSRPFTAKFPGTCSVSGKKIKAGDQVQFVNDRVALVGAVVTPPKPTPAPAGRTIADAKAAAKPADAGRPGRRPFDPRADGRCGFCRSTTVQTCPMCGAGAVSQKIVLTVPVAVPATVEVVKAPTGEVRARAISLIRKAHTDGDKNMAVALIVGLTDLAWKQNLADELAAIDARCASRKFISTDDLIRRDMILAQALDSLKYDPRIEDAPGTVAVPPAPVQAALPAAAGPLQAGDWRQLWIMVQAGQLTDDEAKAFGELWKQQGL